MQTQSPLTCTCSGAAFRHLIRDALSARAKFAPARSPRPTVQVAANAASRAVDEFSLRWSAWVTEICGGGNNTGGPEHERRPAMRLPLPKLTEAGEAPLVSSQVTYQIPEETTAPVPTHTCWPSAWELLVDTATRLADEWQEIVAQALVEGQEKVDAENTELESTRQWVGLALCVRAADCLGVSPSMTDEALRCIDSALIIAGALDEAGVHVRFLRQLLERISVVPDPATKKNWNLAMGDAQCRLPCLEHLEGNLVAELDASASASTAKFVTQFVRLGQPVILRGFARGWPGVADGGERLVDFLSSRRNRWVPVEIGDNYTSTNWRPSIEQLGQVVEAIMATSASPKVGLGKSGRYVAEYPLMDHFPELSRLFPVPAALKFSEGPPLDTDVFARPVTDFATCVLAEQTWGSESASAFDPIRMCWLGPAGTVSPHHQDHYTNIYVHVAGKKYFQLINPDKWTQCLSLIKTSTPLPTTTEADNNGDDAIGRHRSNRSVLTNTCCEIEYDRFLQSAVAASSAAHIDGEIDAPHDPRLHAVLSAGDALFIPYRWWHLVVGLTAGWGVSNWVS